MAPQTKVLILSNDEALVASLRPVLLSEGFELLRARDSSPALRLAREGDGDLVLLDAAWQDPAKRPDDTSPDACRFLRHLRLRLPSGGHCDEPGV
jgi:DNA-binding response OmpR family regulator